jgi:Secretion system C-terminal sorting domain
LVVRSSTQTYSIDPCAACDPIDITIHDDISDLAINAPITDYCPGGTAITLSASFDEGAGGNNNLPYSFLWTPDSGIVANLCSNSPSPMCWSIDVEPERTTTYGVYVTDGQCWSHAEVEIVVPVSHLNLGNDITICDGTAIEIIPNFELSVTPTTTTYLWSPGNTSSTTLSLTPSQGITNYHLSLTINGCLIEDEVTVNAIACCSSGSSVHMQPIEMFIPNSNQNHNEYYNHTENLVTSFSVNCPTCVSQTGGLNNRLSATIDGGTGNPIIFIDGEFRIPYDIETDQNSPGPELDGMDLTLRNLTLSMGENAWINVMSRQRLVLENCTLTSCGSNMWRGIVLDKKGDRNSPEIGFNSLFPCFIENAETAVYLTRESIFNIEGVTFNNCFVDLEIVNQKENSNTNTIFGCNFTSSGAGLIAPHLGERKFAGVVLDDVDLVNIGKNSNVTAEVNTFENSIYGIKSKNSSVKLLNSDFFDIWDDVTTPAFGYAFYSESDFDFTDRSIQIGNGGNSGLNNFQRTFNGVYSVGEMNFDIRRNIFGNVSNVTSDRIRENCIYIDDNGPKNLNISGSASTPNEFHNYTFGVHVSRPNKFSTLLIKDNRFGAAQFIDDTGFEGTAINLVAIGLTALKDAEISDNEIGEPIPLTNPTVANPPLHPRIGIHLSSIALARVINNKISFYHTATPAFFTRGVWAENSRDLELSGNTIENISSTIGSGDLFVGLKMNQSPGSCIENNAITNFGHGISFFGESYLYSLFANTITDFDIGINLTNANIGPTVGTEDVNTPGNNNVMSNIWNLCNGCAATTKIDGSLATALLTWYTNISSGNTFPETGIQQGLIVDNISAGTPLSECPMPFQYLEEVDPPITLRVRNDLFGGVVADSIRYTQEYESEFRYEGKQVVFDVLKNHPTLLDMDDESDDAFIEFYSEMLSSNIKIIDSIEVLIHQKQFMLAYTLLNEFVDTNTIESNYKKVFGYYIKLMLWGADSIDDTDRDELLAIAYENPLLGGKSIYMARTILNLEVNDEPLSSSSRLMQPKKTQKEIILNIYPNPTSNLVHIVLSNSSLAEEIQLSDITERICSKVSDANQMTTSQFLPGVYFLRIKYESYTWNERLIINR